MKQIESEIFIEETADINRIRQLASDCYMDAYKEIHTEEQNRFSFNEMYSAESLRTQLGEQSSRFFILVHDDADQAYAAVCPVSDGVWMLDKLYVLPDCKGLGYGRMLTEHVLKTIKAADEGFHRLVLKVNRRNSAVEFYKHLGFQITGSWDRVIADGRWVMDGYDMELEVSDILTVEGLPDP